MSSERQICKDRSSTCVEMLTNMPTMCGDQYAYADQMCAFSCGFCDMDPEGKF